MKNRLLLDTIRTIKLSRGKFLTLILIVFMGVSFFSGMLSISAAMGESVDSYIDEYNFADFQIYANYGFDDDDINALNGFDESIAAEGAKFVDTKAVFNDSEQVFRVESFDERNDINRLKLVEGRFPTAANEALAEVTSELYITPKIGDVVTITQAASDLDEVLNRTEFTVVGIVTTPNYMSQEKGASTFDNLAFNTFIYVPQENFVSEFYTVAYLKSDDTSGVNSFGSDYDKAVEDDASALEDFTQTQQLVRAQSVIDIATSEYEEALEEYNAAKSDFEQEIENAQEEIDRGYQEIETSQANLAGAKSELESAIEELDKAIAGGFAPPALTAQKAQLAAELASVNTAQKNLDDARTELDDAQNELDESRAEGESELSEALSELATAKDEIDGLLAGEWTVLDRQMHYSMATYSDTVSQMQVLGLVFPVFFFLVSALVCLTTMTRMVDEQRGQVGVLRALGYTRFACAAKYIIYSLSATLIGGLIGAVVGILVFPQIVYTTWNIVYNLPPINYNFPVFNMFISIFIFMVLMGLTTFSAIRIETSQVASSLLRPKAPPAGKVVFLERIPFIWKRFSFTSKVTARNIIRYKKRFAMTVFGIAGCTCLLVSGFGMRDSISGIGQLQYDDLTLHSATVSIEKDATADEAEDLLFGIDALDASATSVLFTSYAANVSFLEEELVGYINVYNDDDELKLMNTVRERNSGKELVLTDNSVLISEKFAELLSVGVGDEIMLEGQDEQSKAVVVGGIFEKYINHEIYMSEEYYHELFSAYPSENAIQIDSDMDEQALQNAVLELENVSGITFNSTIKNSFDNITSSMNIVVVIIIVSAAALAFVVLGNLASINIGERKREIATLKVLGFNSKETKAYIFKENMVLTFFGTAVGAVLGVYAHYFIITQVEMDFIMFIRSVSVQSMLFSVLLTFVFSVVVNRFMLSKLKKIDMIESLKSVE